MLHCSFDSVLNAASSTLWRTCRALNRRLFDEPQIYPQRLFRHQLEGTARCARQLPKIAPPPKKKNTNLKTLNKFNS